MSIYKEPYCAISDAKEHQKQDQELYDAVMDLIVDADNIAREKPVFEYIQPEVESVFEYIHTEVESMFEEKY